MAHRVGQRQIKSARESRQQIRPRGHKTPLGEVLLLREIEGLVIPNFRIELERIEETQGIREFRINDDAAAAIGQRLAVLQATIEFRAPSGRKIVTVGIQISGILVTRLSMIGNRIHAGIQKPSANLARGGRSERLAGPLSEKK